MFGSYFQTTRPFGSFLLSYLTRSRSSASCSGVRVRLPRSGLQQLLLGRPAVSLLPDARGQGSRHRLRPFRSHVVDDHLPHALRVLAGVDLDDAAAHRVPVEHDVLQIELLDQRVEIARVVLGQVLVLGGPVGVAVTPERHGDDVIVLVEERRDLVEAVPRPVDAVQHDERALAGIAPVDIVNLASLLRGDELVLVGGSGCDGQRSSPLLRRRGLVRRGRRAKSAAGAIEAAAMTTAMDDRDRDQDDRICDERGCACFIEPSCVRRSAKPVGNGAADSSRPRAGRSGTAGRWARTPPQHDCRSDLSARTSSSRRRLFDDHRTDAVLDPNRGVVRL